MKQSFDIEATIFQLLKASTDLTTAAITGGIYVGTRPDGSEAEDITINSLTLEQDASPQRGVVNVNIHVKDLDVTIAGQPQKKANNARLKAISGAVIKAIRAYRGTDIGLSLSMEQTFENTEISQHYVNLRIDCTIN